MTFSLGIFLTLLTSITTGFTGRYLGYRGTKLFVLTGAFATVFINTWNLFYIQLVGLSVVDLGEFFSFDLLVINWVLVFDFVTCLMVWMVSLVSASIQLFSCFYMRFDPHFIRFMAYITLFTFFMFLFVSSGNFVFTIWGWEGIGICSYLLITFWFTKVQANKSALKALLVNKVGDIGLLLGVLLVFYFIKSVDLLAVFSLVDLISVARESTESFYYYMLFFGFLLAIIAKSAQFGLHIWLPDAMDGPTPVSALLHSATMVTAGIYLFIKICLVLNIYSELFIIVIFIGSLTALYCALTALAHYDIKKIIAYSTCSQLGYMFVTLGLEQYSLSFLHLLAHAFYKSLLFISAGSIIYALANEQDIRRMGGLRKLLPNTFIFFLIGVFSSMSFPFIATFYAKEIIITNSFLYSSSSFVVKSLSYFSFILILLSVLVTVLYSARLLYLVFFNKFNGFRINLQKIGSESVLYTLAAYFLAFFSIYFSYYLKNSLLASSYLFSGSLISSNFSITEFIPIWLKILPIFFLIAGLYLVYYVYSYHAAKLMYLHIYYNEYYKVIYYSFNVNKLMVYLVRYTLKLSADLYILFDKGVLEKLIELFWNLLVYISSYFYSGQVKSIYATIGLLYANIVVSLGLPIVALFVKQVFHPEVLVAKFIYFKEFFFVRETEILIHSIFKETNGYKIGASKRLGDHVFAIAYPPVMSTRYKGVTEHVSESLDNIITLDVYGFGFNKYFDSFGLILLIIASLFAGFCFLGKYRSMVVNLSFFFVSICLNILFLFAVGLEFFALMLLFIYAGALVTLFLFVLMTSSEEDRVDNRLTNLSYSENRPLYFFIVLVLGLVKMALSLDSIKFILVIMRFVETPISYQAAANYEYMWKFFSISVYGEYLLNFYTIFLLMTSIILFIGMFGSIIITLMAFFILDPKPGQTANGYFVSKNFGFFSSNFLFQLQKVKAGFISFIKRGI